MIETRLELGRSTGEMKMAKANKDGWIRHRGGKQPVADNEFVQTRLRDGTIQGKPMKAGFYSWEHESDSSDIMAYHIHPTDQQEPQPMTAEQIRTKCIENLASIADLHKKNAALVDDLRKMGFDLYDAPKEPQEDMSDPDNWRIGDVLEHTSNKYEYVFTCGGKYTILRKTNDGFVVRDDISDIECGFDQLSEEFKFHSRPTK